MINNKNKLIELIVRLIIKRGDKILLCMNLKGGHYFLPGGHVEYGDKLEQTIYKEMKEELGLENESVTDLVYKTFIEQMWKDNKGGDHHEIDMIFNAKIPDDANTVSKESHIDFVWVDKKDLKNINVLPKKMMPLLFE